MFNNAKIIADNTVGYTKFFLVIKNSKIAPTITINLNKIIDSDNTPAGKITILAIKAAKEAVESFYEGYINYFNEGSLYS